MGGVYVSYTQLHDNANGTICNGTHVGVRSTQVCADTGVYYLSNLNWVGLDPSLIAPTSYSSLGQYGIMGWWPTSASATAYRILNPDGNVVPPIMTTTNDSTFANYMSDYASGNPYALLSTIGQTPGTWSFPVWYVYLHSSPTQCCNQTFKQIANSKPIAAIKAEISGSSTGAKPADTFQTTYTTNRCRAPAGTKVLAPQPSTRP